MGGSDSGGSTVVTTTGSQQGPPQLLPEGREGYNLASQFYRGILTNPPIFGGERLAPVAPAQDEFINQTYDYFGRPQPFQMSAENQVGATTRGDYLGGPMAQSAIASLADPIFARFRDEVVPGIRDRAQFSGQGVTSTRRDVAEQNAMETLGRQLATSVLAPVYESERNRQLTAAGMAPSLLSTEALRLGQLQSGGGFERDLYQQILDTNRQAWEEPLFRQSQSAAALGQMAGMGPGGTSGGVSRQETTTEQSTMDSLMGVAQLGLLAAAVARGK